MDRNKEVLEENAGLRRKYDVLEQSEHELARRNMVYQKTIKTLVRADQAEARAGCSLLHTGMLAAVAQPCSLAKALTRWRGSVGGQCHDRVVATIIAVGSHYLDCAL